MSVADLDQELLAAYRAGELSAFERLYERHARVLLAILWNILGDRDEAEDELQETFVAFAQALSKLDVTVSVRAYLVAMARNRALNRRRGHNRRQDFSRRYEVLFQNRDADAFQEVGANVESAEQLRQLNDGLGQLSEDEREVVLLHTQAELGFREIAELLNTPQGTIATRYRTALGRLREFFAR